jgi:hypothetical protein
MMCCCALAGTKACENCNNRPAYMFKPNVVSVPYTPPVDMEEKRFQEIENAIKRLNERIDELLNILKDPNNE